MSKNSLPETLDEAIEALAGAHHLNICEKMTLLGMDPKTAFAGGDWRNCSFNNCDLRGFDFRNTRLFYADFAHADVTGADFTGAIDLHSTRFHKAHGWANAKLTEYQRNFVLLAEAQSQKSALRYLEPQQWVALVAKSRDFSEATSVYAEMQKAGGAVNMFACTALMSKARTLRDRDHAGEQFEIFLDQGGKPDLGMMTVRMDLELDPEAARNIFFAMEENGLGPDKYAYNLLISKHKNDQVAGWRIFREMRQKGIEISRYTAFSLFDCCGDQFSDAVEVLVEVHKAGVNVFGMEFIHEMMQRTAYPELTKHKVAFRAEGMQSPREIIRKMISECLSDPWRKNSLNALGLL